MARGIIKHLKRMYVLLAAFSLFFLFNISLTSRYVVFAEVPDVFFVLRFTQQKSTAKTKNRSIPKKCIMHLASVWFLEKKSHSFVTFFFPGAQAVDVGQTPWSMGGGAQKPFETVDSPGWTLMSKKSVLYHFSGQFITTFPTGWSPQMVV